MAWLVLTGGAAADRAPCLRYEPQAVELTGRLVRRTHPGPPNYESVRQGDAPVTYWYLELDRPICVELAPEGDDTPAESGVRTVQIITDAYAKHRRLVGRRVKIAGTLMHAETGHHFTAVLIEAQRIEAAARARRR